MQWYSMLYMVHWTLFDRWLWWLVMVLVGPCVSSRSFDFLLVSHPRHAEFMDLVVDEASNAPSNDHHGAQTVAVA
eukprot:COSAG01_NODE_21782_length_885_cov_1.318066_1_plen_74_part_10